MIHRRFSSRLKRSCVTKGKKSIVKRPISNTSCYPYFCPTREFVRSSNVVHVYYAVATRTIITKHNTNKVNECQKHWVRTIEKMVDRACIPAAHKLNMRLEAYVSSSRNESFIIVFLTIWNSQAVQLFYQYVPTIISMHLKPLNLPSMKLCTSLIIACVIATTTAKLTEKDSKNIHLQQIERNNETAVNVVVPSFTRRESRREANAATYHYFERQRRGCEYDLSTNSRTCFDILKWWRRFKQPIEMLL